MQLGFLQFYLKTKGTTFMDCSLLAVDFMSADLTGAVLIIVIYIVLNLKSDCQKPTLEAVIITRLTLQEQNSKAQFSLTGLKGLLAKHDIIVQ
jgi:hypothetical protein